MTIKLNPFTGEPEWIGLEYIYKALAPTAADNGYAVPTLWIDTVANKAYLLVDVTGGVATWLKILNANIDDITVLSYADAALSGVPVLLRVSADGVYGYVKAYPTTAAAAAATADSVIDNPYSIVDATLSGDAVVFGLVTGGVEYFFKTYPTPASITYSAGDATLRLQKYSDAALSGTPRIAKAVVSGTAYYFKVYPARA